MSASSEFRKLFTKSHLRHLYNSEIRYKYTPGIDGIKPAQFDRMLDESIETILRKVKKGTYRFSQYREKLLSRGPKKPPRVISIPTLRDKLVLKALFELIAGVYGDDAPFLHEIISQVKDSYRLGLYDAVVRTDVKDFYPSINHEKLFRIMRKKIRKREIICLLENAIGQVTVAKAQRKTRGTNEVGVPQGLSISNILANIYMSPIDKKHSNKSEYKYFRYVDDILVLCRAKDLTETKTSLETDCNAIGLNLHEEEENSDKCLAKKLGCEEIDFDYLGYRFCGGKVSVRKKTVERLCESLIKALTIYKYRKPKKLESLRWALNLRITGCIFEKRKFGWLFFFSQMDDHTLLGWLDHFLSRQMDRFGVNLRIKRFTKAFHEITRNMSRTSYIPNFDKYSVSQKRLILANVFRLDSANMTAPQAEYHFKRKILGKIRDLERDLAAAS